MGRPPKVDGSKCPKCHRTGLRWKKDPNGSNVLFDETLGEFHGGKLRVCDKYLQQRNEQEQNEQNEQEQEQEQEQQEQQEQQQEQQQDTKPPSIKDALARQVYEAIEPHVKAEYEQYVKDALSKGIKAIAKGNTDRETIEIHIPETDTKIDCQGEHKFFPKLIYYLMHKKNVLMGGPSGSGKTTAAEHAAHHMGLPFYYTAVCEQTQLYELTGYETVSGEFIETPLTKAFTGGGIWLLDEVDAGSPNILLAVNALVEQRRMWDIKTKTMVNAHPDFIALAAGNTSGNGATAQYVGRNRLDKAFLNRYSYLHWGYDEELEREICTARGWTSRECQAWINRVQKIRAAVMRQSADLLVTPRATFTGCAMLAAGLPKGMTVEDIENSEIFKGLDADDCDQIRSEAGLLKGNN